MNSTATQILKTILTAFAIGGVGFFVMSWVLTPFFLGQVLIPQHFQIFGLRIQLYGLLIACAAFAGYWLAVKRRLRYGINSDEADKIILWVVIAGFVGARVYHVLSEIGLYVNNPFQVFAIWNGGLSIYGAAIGGVLAVAFFVWRFQTYSLLHVLDWLAPSVVLGQIIGRFGNFVNYELYGLPTTLPWKMFVPIQFRMPPYELSQFFHPLFLYEAAASAVILTILLRLKLKTGYLFLLWLLMYNVVRFLLEYLRVDSVIYSGVRVNAIVSLILVIAAIGMWYALYRKNLNQFH